jgi:serpin B
MKLKVKALSIFVVVMIFLDVVPEIRAGRDAVMIADANNKFAFSVYADLARSEAGKNIFISPYSIATALAMTYEGAAGETAAQIQKVFHFPPDINGMHQGYFEMQNILNAPNKDYDLLSANSLWPQKGWEFSTQYLDAVEKYYGGKAELVDYYGQKAAAIYKINSWTSNRTKKKIPEILGGDDVDELTRLVLVNAVYFKGSWKSKFDPKSTRKSSFYTGGNIKTQTDMMRLEGQFKFAELEGLKILELPYAGNDISMMVALPDGHDISKLEASLSDQEFKKWQAALMERKVDVSLPKFKLHCLYTLNKSLIRLGMPLAFNENRADFSKMTGKKGLYISAAVHATFVDVNEEGTEAAAASAVVMGTKSIEMTPEFNADHPFIIVIYDKAAGAILFIGKINDPSAGGEKK